MTVTSKQTDTLTWTATEPPPPPSSTPSPPTTATPLCRVYTAKPHGDPLSPRLSLFLTNSLLPFDTLQYFSSSEFFRLDYRFVAPSEVAMDMESTRKWFVEHKLRAVGTLWASSLLGSFAYNFSQPGMKTSVKLIHARLHAQALTLAALAGSAVVEYYDHKSGDKAKRYEKHFETS